MIKTSKFKDICKEKDWTKKFQKLLMESDSEIITFNPGEIKKRIEKIRKKKSKAYDMLLEVDGDIYTLLGELSGTK